MMKRLTWDDRWRDGVIALWNRTAVRDGYKEMTPEEFDRIIRLSPYFDPACAFLLGEMEEMAGTANAEGDGQAGAGRNSTGDGAANASAEHAGTGDRAANADTGQGGTGDGAANTGAGQSGTGDRAANAGAEQAGTEVGAAETGPGGAVIRGFACGCTGDDIPLGDKAGYLTCILLDEAVRTDAHCDALLSAVEERFRQLGKTQADVLFFNPMRLPWYIPDTPGHEHNNAPGVPADSPLHSFLLRRGYAERARECGMYLPLAGFTIPADIRRKEEQAAAAGYRIELFDPARHAGLGELLASFANPAWESELARCAAERVPFLIVSREGRAVGFAGPVVREPGGRAYFAGIGIHPQHEGRGLGSVLFFKLCEAFEAAGADYMSLFTGRNNPALGIYEKAGFRIVRQFAIMRKELERHE